MIFGILCFMVILKMQFFATILISIFATAFALLGSKNIRKSLTYGGIILIIFGLLPKQIYVAPLTIVGSYFNPESENYKKFTDFAEYIEYGKQNDNSISGRLDRYPLLWKGFIANPFTGFYNSNSMLDISPGGHLFWMNRLAVYGLFGFIPFILIFYFYIKKRSKQFDKEFNYYFLLSMFSGILLGFMKNFAGMDFWCVFFFIIPSLYYLPMQKKRNIQATEKTKKISAPLQSSSRIPYPGDIRVALTKELKIK